MAQIARHGFYKPRIAPVWPVTRGNARRQLVDRGREVGQEAPRLGKGVGLALGLIVYGTVLRVDGRAAQLFLGAIFAHGSHNGWPGDEHLRHAFHQNRIMRHHLPPRAKPGHRAKPQRHHRHG